MAWSLGLFGLLRLRWVESHLLLPVTRFQGAVGSTWFGSPSAPIEVTLACSGADALALCGGAILAYPATWRMRSAGMAGGIALILLFNTIRIGTLGFAAASPAWFNALHLYVWPAALMLAIAAYVFAWMRHADSRRVLAPAAPATMASRSPAHPPGLTRRFIVAAAICLVLFSVASPLYLESAGVLALAAWMTRAAAATLGLIGIPATASANVLTTSQGGFLVTQECIVTPLIPVYFAAVLTYSSTWMRCAPALLAAAPLFAALGVARLLIVALPATLVGSPLFYVHAFYQLLLAAVVVVGTAYWRHGPGPAAWRRAIAGGVLGVVAVYLAGPVYSRALAPAFASSTPLQDPQGAIALLPAFQLGLFVALSAVALAVLRWRSLAAGLVALAASQAILFVVLHAIARHYAFTPHVRDIRAWAIAGPMLIVAALVTYDRPRR